MELQELIKNLSVVGRSPLALVAYIAVVGAWVTRAVLVYRPQMRAKEILRLYHGDDEHKNVALAQLFGNDPPRGLPDQETLDWVKIQAGLQNRRLLLIAYLATIVLVLAMVGIAATHPVDNSGPILERGSVTVK